MFSIFLTTTQQQRPTLPDCRHPLGAHIQVPKAPRSQSSVLSSPRVEESIATIYYKIAEEHRNRNPFSHIRVVASDVICGWIPDHCTATTTYPARLQRPIRHSYSVTQAPRSKP